MLVKNFFIFATTPLQYHMKKISSLLLGLGVVFTVSLTSCGGNEKQNELVATPNAEAENSSETFDSFTLPSPLQVAAIYQKSGLTYVPNVTNSPSISNVYNTQLSRTLNVGVYTADLAYSVLNGQTATALEYLNAIRGLSKDIGISEAYNPTEMFERVENNLGNPDSIIYILAEIQENMESFLEETDQKEKSVILFAGAWVEGMYVGTRALKSASNEALESKILEQLNILDLILKGFNAQPSKTSELKHLVEMLNELKNTMNFDQDNSRALTAEERAKIYDQITLIRDEITKV